MRKVLPYLGASLSALAMAWSTPVLAQDAAFKDLDSNHWAYQAVTELQTKGILKGYVDGYFRGKRTLTRYEFAVALQRLLANLPAGGAGGVGPQGPAGPQGEPGPAGPPGLTPEEVANLRRLTDEFRQELTSLGANVRDINNRLDAQARQIADITDRLNRMVQLSGDVFVGFRSNLSRNAFLDYSGATQGPSRSLFSGVDSPHDFHLGVKANIPGGTRFEGDIVESNYLSYRAQSGIALGGPSSANTNGNAQQTTLYKAALTVPIGGPASGVGLTLGRFGNQVTPLTYYRPDTDAYFDLPIYDDGNYVQDGFKIDAKFGSARTTLFAGSYSDLTTSSGGLYINRPLIGASLGPRAFGPFKPFGLNSINQGAILANQSAGIHIGVPLFTYGEIGVTAIDFSGANQTGSPFSIDGGPAFNNVVVYGVNAKITALGRIALSAEAAKSVTQAAFDRADGRDNEDNNAYTGTLGYNSGPVTATAGYQYIDPRFAAPGYWNKLGNWYNPTNISGPFVRVGYKFSNVLQGYLGGDYYNGARNRPGAFGLGTGFTQGSNIGRATAGIKFNLNKMVNFSGAYEGVFYDLSGAVTPSGLRAKPIEQYITIGAGLNLTSNTILKLAYQIINVNDNGSAFSGGGVSNPTSNANVFTTQVAVHF